MGTDNPLKLGKGARIAIAVFSFLFALMMLPMAFDPLRPELGIINILPSAFCFLIVGACILPSKFGGYCGDFIAFVVLGLAIWFFFSAYNNPKPDDNPIRFALIFGGLSVMYLWNRYGKYLVIKLS